MKILVIDAEELGLDVALRLKEEGHETRLWMCPEKGGEPSRIGEGMVEKVKEWKPSMKWADLIILTTNSKYGGQLEPFFTAGYPIIGANRESALLELDRSRGQQEFGECGISTLPFEVFSSVSKAIAHIKRTGKRYVSKPWGGNPDKALSYVSRGPDDMILKLEKLDSLGKMKGEFVLQEAIEGVEMAVGGWFGPGGFSKWYNENWEEKRLFAGGMGPNTGEAGTIMRYTKKSRLANEVLLPIEDTLSQMKYVGYVDVNCIIEDGHPWPLEFTMRFGWPHFLLCMDLQKGDMGEWLWHLYNGSDTLDCKKEVCVGVVIAHGDYPHSHMKLEEIEGYPIEGRGEGIHLCAAREEGDEIVTAGDYVAVVTGLGDTVREASKECYGRAEEVKWGNDPFYRNDIGVRLKKDLKELHKNGYAEGMEYGN